MSRSLILTAMAATLLALPVLAQDVTPGYMPVPGTDTKIHVYGFAQLTGGLYLNQGEGSLNGLAGASYNNANGATSQTYLTGQTSRFGFQTITSSSALGDIGTQIECDFNASGAARPGNFNFRHAYITVGGWTLGQQDSLFSDPDAGLNAIDWNGFAGGTNWGTSRDAAVRYDAKLNAQSTLSVALEQNLNCTNLSASAQNANYSIVGLTPAQQAEVTAGTFPAEADQKYPNLVAAYTFADSWGHVRVSAVEQYYGAQINAIAGTGKQNFSTWTSTVAAGTKIKLGKDNVSATIYTGKNPGQYGYGDTYSTLNIATNSWSMDTQTGFCIAYTHAWDDVYSSSIGYSGLSISSDPVKGTPAEASSTHLKTYMGVYVNLQAQLTKTFGYGVEFKNEKNTYLGTNVAFDSNGNLNKNNITNNQITFNLTATF